MKPRVNKPAGKLTVLVSSSVYGIEELLNRIHTLLTAYGYEVWMSHKGTMPVFSKLSAFENCLAAVGKCDLFLGYEDAILSDKPVRDRQGNWVQKYRGEEEATLFATAQFFRYQEVEAFVREDFADTAKMAKTVKKGGRR